MEFLTAKDIAAMLRCSEWFVYRNHKMFGGVKLGRLVRFRKDIFERIMEVKFNDSLQASREMALGLLEGRAEVQGHGADKTGGKERRSRSAQKNQKDEFGLYKAVCQPPEGTEG